MPNPNLTHIEFLLDRSGSMSHIKSATIAAFNKFLQEQQAVEGEATITLTEFNTYYKNVFTSLPLRSILPLNEESFRPEGGTALRGAIGRATDELGARLSLLPEEYRPGKVLVVVLTDGEERDSHRTYWASKYTKGVLNQKVSHQENAYQWTYIYLGAGENAREAAISYGFTKGNTMAFSPTGASVTEGIRRMSDGISSYRMSSEQRATDIYGGATHADDSLNGSKAEAAAKPADTRWKTAVS